MVQISLFEIISMGYAKKNCIFSEINKRCNFEEAKIWYIDRYKETEYEEVESLKSS